MSNRLGVGAALIMVTALAGCAGPGGAGLAAAGAGVASPTAPAAAAAAAAQPSVNTAAMAPAEPARGDRIGPPALGPVAAGQRPPQVVVFGFDDSGNAVENTDGTYAIFDYWRKVSRAYNARMTFFLSGPMLLTSQTLHTYDAPQLGPGNSHMGFAFDHAETLPGESQLDAVRHEMNNLKGAYAEGNEIATHYGGHICGKSPGAVGSFSAADWEHEVEQFDKMVDNANQTNNLTPPVNLGFTSKDIVGSRTPCLEGNFHNLYPVLAKHGYTYDTSPTPFVRWPYRGTSDTGPTNLWTIGLPDWHMYGSTRYELGMDYNICAWHDPDCEDRWVSPATSDQWGQQMLDTERAYFEKSYTGDRAPINFGNHPEMWDHGTYTRAIASIAKEVCNKPEVRCVSYGELAGWLNTVPAAQLDSWRTGSFPHYTDPNPPAYGTAVRNVLMPPMLAPKPPHKDKAPQPEGSPQPDKSPQPTRSPHPRATAMPAVASERRTPSPN
jgi:hypothetical protein